MSASDPAPLGLDPSFGFGDRLGVATPGHIAAMNRRGAGIRPVFAQQSVREMTRTNRTPADVIADARRGVAVARWTGRFGADADHLKTSDDIAAAAAAGFVMFTVDVSAEIDHEADELGADELGARLRAQASASAWMERYGTRSVALSNGIGLDLDSFTVGRTLLKFGRAIDVACELSMRVAREGAARDQPFEIELSVDESPRPTTAAEHFMIVDQCLDRGVRFVSFAPRYPGRMEKGIDYTEDIGDFERSLAAHVAIAEALGPYKLSLHSGSDKLSVYPSLARITGGRFHVKTAGTSYLEALRVVLRHDESLFRRIVGYARRSYRRDRRTYAVSASLARVPPPSDLRSAVQLEDAYLQRWERVEGIRGFTTLGRQILHTTFGSVMRSDAFGPEVMAVLDRHQDTYASLLDEHFGRHLDALRLGLD